MSPVKPEVITQAFANQGNFSPPPATSSTTVANQPLGFPPLQATPYTSGGLPVTIDQMNGVFFTYSSILNWLQAGGTFTFEPTVSSANNGYNQGAVLAYIRPDGSIGYVFSNKANNTDNFVTTPSFIGISWIDVSTLQFPSINNASLQSLVMSTASNANSTVGNISSVQDGNGNIANNLLINDSAGNTINVNMNVSTLTGLVYSNWVAANNSNQASQMGIYLDSGGSPVTESIIYSDFATKTINTGVTTTFGNRPFLTGSNVSALGTTGNSIAILNDLVNFITSSALAPYVLQSSLTSQLAAYVLQSSLDSQLTQSTLNTNLAATLASYLQRSNFPSGGAATTTYFWIVANGFPAPGILVQIGQSTIPHNSGNSINLPYGIPFPHSSFFVTISPNSFNSGALGSMPTAQALNSNFYQVIGANYGFDLVLNYLAIGW